MAEPRHTLALVANEFRPRTPAQQLLDRFLIGYPYEGKFRRNRDRRVILHVTGVADRHEIAQRVKDHGLVEEQGLAAAVGNADAVLSVGVPVVEHLRRGAKCFIYGALADTREAANALLQQARSKQCALLAGTATRGATLLPQLHIAPGMPLAKGLIIVQGPYPAGELEGLEGLMPLVAKRKNASFQVRKVQGLSGANVWPALKRDFWPLVKSAISRTDTPQGDAVQDGRTQDLARLNLIEPLAKSLRAWLVEYTDGFAAAVLVLDGVVADYNCALQTNTGQIISAQLYRPPPPGEHHYSNLAAVIEPFFDTGTGPWPVEQNFAIVDLLERFRS